jgi:hypothetical protein
MTQFTCKGVKQINNRISFTFVSLWGLIVSIPVNPSPFHGSLPRKSLISRMDWVSCAGDINVPHDLPPTKKSSTIKMLPFSHHNHTINILSLNYSKSCNTCNLHSIWEIRWLNIINKVNGLNYNINNIKEYFNSLNECVLMILNFDLK